MCQYLISIAIAITALASNANAQYSNTSLPFSTVDFVTGTYLSNTPVTPTAACPDLNFNFKNHGSYPSATGSVIAASDLGNDDYEITFQFSASDCADISNLDQAKIIGVESPESSEYILYDSNQNIKKISNACNWDATFVVTGEQTGSQICVPQFQIHYAWFSGKADNNEASSWTYNSAYEYLASCNADNNNNAQADFPQYCWSVGSLPLTSSSSSLSSSSSFSLSSSSATLSTSSSIYQYPSTSSTSTTSSLLLTTITIPSSSSSSSVAPITSYTPSSTLSTSTSSPDALVSAWGQCGGENYSGATDCCADFHCESWNPYYYQCVPGAPSTSATTSTSSTSSTTTQGVCATMWAQCGGINFSGATECCGDSHCSSMNPYYYQCLSGSPTTATTF